MTYPPNSKCPCHSALPYKKCCGPYHKPNPTKPPPTPEALMRSRFAAYALRMTGYIMKTTHPESAQYQSDAVAWHKEILAFSSATRFKGLSILDAPTPLDNAVQATVTFHANLLAHNEDHSFTEKSTFLRHDNHWKYFGAEFLEP